MTKYAPCGKRCEGWWRRRISGRRGVCTRSKLVQGLGTCGSVCVASRRHLNGERCENTRKLELESSLENRYLVEYDP